MSRADGAAGLTFTEVELLIASPGPVGELPILEVIEPVEVGADYFPTYFSSTGRHAAGRILPYHPRAAYDRQPKWRKTRVAVLENEYLRAVFLLEFGGRLWSLVDKIAERELLHQAEPVLAANLALRNAWFAGGVEWNLGTRGHWPLTFDAVHASRLIAGSGEPVLRMWEFERMLRITWRLDAWLPSGSRALFVRPVVHNPTSGVVPVYWWSNIAVPQEERSRVLVPAVRALHFGYEGHPTELSIPSPSGSDRDASYPAIAGDSADYFFDLAGEDRRPWIAAIDGNGYGLAQVSTSRLRGRKLFVWGTNRGGEHWQQWLSGSGRYFEIQAGLARTQYEQQDLPPGASFAWTEAYAPVQIDAGSAHSWQWSRAIGAAAESIEQVVSTAALESADRKAERWEHVPPDEPPAAVGAGWGALEVLAGHRRPNLATPYYDHTIGPEQQPWLDLASHGNLPVQEPPAATISGAQWRQRLTGRCSSWHDWLQLALLELAEGNLRPAIAALDHSLAVTPTAWARRHLANLLDQADEPDAAAQHAALGLQAEPSSAQLVIDLLQVLARHGRFDQMLEAIDRLRKPVRGLPRVRLYECVAAVGSGAVPRATKLFQRGLSLPDIREGEDSLDELWYAYQEAIGGVVPLPQQYDFRMHTEEDPPLVVEGQRQS